MNKSRVKSSLSVLLLILPRSVATYPAYFLGSILLMRFNRQLVARLALVFIFFFTVFASYLVFDFEVSPTSFILACALYFPFLYFLVGGRYNLGRIRPEAVLRGLNLVVAVLSLYNMVRLGFPVRLPYIHYPPDMYSALYGLGGAKIITVIGFFGIITELYSSGKLRFRLSFWLVVSFLNFIVPSYLIGTICGVTALLLANIRKISLQIVLVFIALILAEFIFTRVGRINTTLSDVHGFHPKILAIISVIDLNTMYPVTFFTGTGLGQFASTAAEWGSDYLSISSERIGTAIPGLFMSEFHDYALGPYLALGSETSWAISSSMNKPYSSFTVLIAELGFPVAVLFMIRLAYLLLKITDTGKLNYTVLFFVFSMFLLDVWHDNFWFFFCILLLTSFSGQDRKDVNAKTEQDRERYVIRSGS